MTFSFSAEITFIDIINRAKWWCDATLFNHGAGYWLRSKIWDFVSVELFTETRGTFLSFSPAAKVIVLYQQLTERRNQGHFLILFCFYEQKAIWKNTFWMLTKMKAFDFSNFGVARVHPLFCYCISEGSLVIELLISSFQLWKLLLLLLVFVFK